jgi:hypothetical protein
MIDTQTETVLPFSAAAKRIPPLRNGKAVSPSTLWRWSAFGCIARNGQRIRLETIRIGGSTCTSIEALDRFFRALTGDQQETAQAAPRAAGKAHRRAEKVLDAAGI